MTKEEMLNNIIKKWGLEHDATRTFASLMNNKKLSEHAIEELYKGLMDL